VSKEFQHPAIHTKIKQRFGRFFHQIKVRQKIGRQDSMQTLIQTSRRLDSFLHEAAQNFEASQIFKSEIKNQKPIAVDVLFKAYPMGPLSCRSNLAGRYLKLGLGRGRGARQRAEDRLGEVGGCKT
jgi:hypothetical protein